MTAGPDLYDLIRQLKAELEWAVRTGIVIEERPTAPTTAVESPQLSAPPQRTAPDDDTPPWPSDDQQPPPAPTDREAPSSRPQQQPQRPQPQQQAQRPQPQRSAPPWQRDRDQPSQPLREVQPKPQRDQRSPPPGRDRGAWQQQQQQQQPNGPAELDREGRKRTEEALVQIGARPSLAAIREVLGDCTRCKLHRQGRTQIVFGVGNATAELMFVGEGPGQDEDRQGEPFVGKAGQLLTKIIESGMGLRRADVYIANIVKCRPPQNRDPEPDEVDACEPFLKAQIRSINPKVIITLGKHASHALLRSSTPITRLRGRWSEYDGIPVMPTYHPAYLLRNPAEKRAVWEDVQEVLRKLGRPLPERGARD